MAIVTLVGLQIADEEGYQTYRDQMMPILQKYGGEFGYDFKVSKVLKSMTKDPINRVFTISFPNQDSRDSFFSNADYLQIRQRHFEKSVSATTIIAAYER